MVGLSSAKALRVLSVTAGSHYLSRSSFVLQMVYLWLYNLNKSQLTPPAGLLHMNESTAGLPACPDNASLSLTC